VEINEVSQNNIIVLFKKYCLSWWYLFYLYFYVNSIHVFLMRVFFSDLFFKCFCIFSSTVAHVQCVTLSQRPLAPRRFFWRELHINWHFP